MPAVRNEMGGAKPGSCGLGEVVIEAQKVAEALLGAGATNSLAHGSGPVRATATPRTANRPDYGAI